MVISPSLPQTSFYCWVIVDLDVASYFHALIFTCYLFSYPYFPVISYFRALIFTWCSTLLHIFLHHILCSYTDFTWYIFKHWFLREILDILFSCTHFYVIFYFHALFFTWYLTLLHRFLHILFFIYWFFLLYPIFIHWFLYDFLFLYTDITWFPIFMVRHQVCMRHPCARPEDMYSNFSGSFFFPSIHKCVMYPVLQPKNSASTGYIQHKSFIWEPIL